jgi:hypothetical protein
MKTLADPNVLGPILTIFATVISLLAPLIAAFVIIAAKRVTKAAGITITEKQQVELERAATLAVSGVDEYLRNAAKNGLTMSSNEKLDLAARIARELAQDGLKAWSDQQVKTAVESKLPEQRAKLASIRPPAFPAPPGFDDELTTHR